jgi:hypothetical protein
MKRKERTKHSYLEPQIDNILILKIDKMLNLNLYMLDIEKNILILISFFHFLI